MMILRSESAARATHRAGRSREKGREELRPWLPVRQRLTGHGYATFACQVLVEQARLLGGTDAWAGVTKGNFPSERVLTRLGFERVADMGTYTRFHRSLAPDPQSPLERLICPGTRRFYERD
jgi:RimJ/RimL family protein N-acetyltransferase